MDFNKCRRCAHSAYRKQVRSGETGLWCDRKETWIDYDKIAGTCKQFDKDTIENHIYE